MKTLVIGGSGFVGHYLIKHLVEVGWQTEVTCLPNEEITANVPVHKLDILNTSEIDRIIDLVKPKAIIHLAAQSSVALSWAEPALTIDVNIKGSVNLLEAVKKTDKSIRVLLIGSGEQYGIVPSEHTPIKEDEPQTPESIYALTKYTQDILGALYTKAYDMDIIRVRAFNHIGPRQSPQFVVSDFCRQVALLEKGNGPYLIKVGNLSAKRDFTDVRDVVRAYCLLCEKGVKGNPYNVGSGISVTIQSLLDTIVNLSSKKIIVEIDPERLRPIDVPIIEADITKLVNDTGWQKQISIEQTVYDTLNFWRNYC